MVVVRYFGLVFPGVESEWWLAAAAVAAAVAAVRRGTPRPRFRRCMPCDQLLLLLLLYRFLIGGDALLLLLLLDSAADSRPRNQPVNAPSCFCAVTFGPSGLLGTLLVLGRFK